MPLAHSVNHACCSLTAFSRSQGHATVVNASLNWASIVGIVLAVGGALLYFMRSFKPALARDYDGSLPSVFSMASGFSGLAPDPIL